MCKVNSFLGCVRLEKYAIFTGWYSLIRTTFFIVLVIVMNCLSYRGFLQCYFILMLLGCLFIIHLQLIDGVHYRDPQKVKVFRNLCMVCMVFAASLLALAMLLISDEQTSDLIPSNAVAEIFVLLILYLMLQIVDFICIHSLYSKFKQEKIPRAVVLS